MCVFVCMYMYICVYLRWDKTTISWAAWDPNSSNESTPRLLYIATIPFGAQLLFPSGDARALLPIGSPSSPRTPVPSSVSDSELLAALQRVRLPELASRVGGLDASADWAHMLSLGEQQRVAVLRLLLHRPQLAFLDEATSALDGPTEAALYGALGDSCGSYVSVGHRMQLLAYHSHVLCNQGGGVWALMTTASYRAVHGE